MKIVKKGDTIKARIDFMDFSKDRLYIVDQIDMDGDPRCLDDAGEMYYMLDGQYEVVDSVTAHGAPDYMDGNWHQWLGDLTCPVEDMVLVRTVFMSGRIPVLSTANRQAGNQVWENVVAFCVMPAEVTVPKEPRVRWVQPYDCWDAKLQDGMIRVVDAPRSPLEE